MAHNKTPYAGLNKPDSLSLKVDPAKMFVENIDQMELNYISTINSIRLSVSSAVELRTINTTDTTKYIDGTMVLVRGVGIFYFDSASTLTDDSINTIKPTVGPGRWVIASRINTFKTAGGTATAILIDGFILTNNNSVTFIASADNGSAATTINGKPLYKPGTTTAPSIKSGKAVTAWYNSAGDRFFVKASSEGNSIADNVLAGKIFSNDDDLGLVGTMPDNPNTNLATYRKTLTNLIINGDLSNGTTGWTNRGFASMTVSNNELICLADGKNDYMSGYVSLVSGHIYYARALVKATSNLVKFIVYDGSTSISIPHSGDGNYQTLSQRYTASTTVNTPYGVQIYDSRPSGWSNIYAKYFLVTDLTTIFGAGSEPTLTQMDTIMTASGWFDKNMVLVSYPYGAHINNGSFGVPQATLVDNSLVTGNIKAGTTILGVTGKTEVVDTTEATNPITAPNVLVGKIGSVNGSKITGTMPNRSGAHTLGIAGDAVIFAGRMYIKPAAGYYDGVNAWAYMEDADLVSANLRAGVDVYGLVGKASVVETEDATVVAAEMRSGKTAYKNGVKITGNMPEFLSNGFTIPTSTAGTENVLLNIPKGYYDKDNASYYANDANLRPENILAGKTIFGNVGTAKRKATGTTVSSSVSSLSTSLDGTRSYAMHLLTVSGLTFTPSMIIARRANSPDDFVMYTGFGSAYQKVAVVVSPNQTTGTSYYFKCDGNPLDVSSTGFVLPVYMVSGTYYWEAVE